SWAGRGSPSRSSWGFAAATPISTTCALSSNWRARTGITEAESHALQGVPSFSMQQVTVCGTRVSLKVSPYTMPQQQFTDTLRHLVDEVRDGKVRCFASRVYYEDQRADCGWRNARRAGRGSCQA